MKQRKNIANTYEYKRFEKEAKQEKAWLFATAYFFKEYETKIKDSYNLNKTN